MIISSSTRQANPSKTFFTYIEVMILLKNCYFVKNTVTVVIIEIKVIVRSNDCTMK